MELVLAVAGDHAGGVVEVFALFRKADSVNVLLELDRFFEEEKSHVIAEVAAVEPLVTFDVCYTVLLVREDLLLVLCVPVSQADSQLARIFAADDRGNSCQELNRK